MRLYDTEVFYAHGYQFKIKYNKFGYLLVHDQKWIWRDRNKPKLYKLANRIAIRKMKKHVNKV